MIDDHVSPGDGQPPARPVVAASWLRCDRTGSPQAADDWAPVRLSGERLRAHRETHPLARTVDLCRDVLADAVRDTGSVYAVGDATGLLLWVEGDRVARRQLERVRFHEGADWSEAGAGTNAPGTALALGAPVQVIAHEHYNEAIRGWSCAAAPVFDPDSGRALGAVDVTGRDGPGSPHALALVRAVARAVEVDLRRVLTLADDRARRLSGLDQGVVGGEAALLSRSGRIVQATGRFRPDTGMILACGRDRVTLADGRQFEIEPICSGDYLVARRLGAQLGGRRGTGRPLELTALGRDRAVLVAGGRRLVLTPRQSEVVTLLALAGEGLSAGRLAVALFRADSAEVAVRVTMTRLRKVLGDDVLGSHPYRLHGAVRCDVHLVRDLLQEGRLAEALDLYAGPLLPGSDAPGVLDHRDVLEQQLRGAVLAGGDPRLLRRWVYSSWGAEDLPAWERLARLLPVGTPQHAAAVARIHALLTCTRPVPVAAVGLHRDGRRPVSRTVPPDGSPARPVLRPTVAPLDGSSGRR